MSNSIPSSLKNSNNGSSIEGSNLRRTSWCLSSGNSATTAALINYHNNLPRNSIEWLSKQQQRESQKQLNMLNCEDSDQKIERENEDLLEEDIEGDENTNILNMSDSGRKQYKVLQQQQGGISNLERNPEKESQRKARPAFQIHDEDYFQTDEISFSKNHTDGNNALQQEELQQQEMQQSGRSPMQNTHNALPQQQNQQQHQDQPRNDFSQIQSQLQQVNLQQMPHSERTNIDMQSYQQHRQPILAPQSHRQPETRSLFEQQHQDTAKPNNFMNRQFLKTLPSTITTNTTAPSPYLNKKPFQPSSIPTRTTFDSTDWQQCVESTQSLTLPSTGNNYYQIHNSDSSTALPQTISKRSALPAMVTPNQGYQQSHLTANHNINSNQNHLQGNFIQGQYGLPPSSRTSSSRLFLQQQSAPPCSAAPGTYHTRTQRSQSSYSSSSMNAYQPNKQQSSLNLHNNNFQSCSVKTSTYPGDENDLEDEEMNANCVGRNQHNNNNQDELTLPATCRQALCENGLKYSAEEFEKVLEVYNTGEDEMRRLKYYFLPLKIKEQEQLLETNNKNIIALQASLQTLLKREETMTREFNEQLERQQLEIVSLQERQKSLKSEILDKDTQIRSVVAQLESKVGQIAQFQEIIAEQRDQIQAISNAKSELEYLVKEKVMQLKSVCAENSEIKEENRLLRDQKQELVDSITELEQAVEERGNRETRMILERKNQQEDYSIRQAQLNSENQKLRDDNMALNVMNKKLIRNVQDQTDELYVLKQRVLELGQGVTEGIAVSGMNRGFGGVAASKRFQENSGGQIGGKEIPIAIVNQYLELLKKQLKTLEELREKTAAGGGGEGRNGKKEEEEEQEIINENQDQKQSNDNKVLMNNNSSSNRSGSAFTRQELD